MGGLRGRRRSPVHRIALSPACWGINEAHDWGHQIDVDRVLSEAAAIGEGAITAGPPPLPPHRSDHATYPLRRQPLPDWARAVHPHLPPPAHPRPQAAPT